jgi:hypothetical protein
MNADVYIVCAEPATVNVYTEECSFYEADLHFFPKNYSCSLINACVTNRKQLPRDIWISNEKLNSRFKQNWSYTNMKYYLCRAEKFDRS